VRPKSRLFLNKWLFLPTPDMIRRSECFRLIVEMLCVKEKRDATFPPPNYAFHLVPTKMETKTWPSVNSFSHILCLGRECVLCCVMMYGSAFFWIKLRPSEWRDHRGSIIMSLATAPERADLTSDGGACAASITFHTGWYVTAGVNENTNKVWRENTHFEKNGESIIW